MKTRPRARKSTALATVTPKPVSQRYATVYDLMLARTTTGYLFGEGEPIPGQSVTIPAGVYPGYDPAPGRYVEVMHFCDLMTGTRSELTDPAMWRLREIEAPAAVPVPGDVATAEFTVVQPPRALGLGALSPAEEAAWRRWQRALTEDSADEEGAA